MSILREIPYDKNITSAISGTHYEIKLATILLIRAYYRKYTNFRVAVEFKDAEKFDDVVLEYDLNENERIKYYIQLKHSESQNAVITEEQLTNEKGDFCLAKYFHSYMKINSNSKTASNKQTKIKYIIFTNIKLDDKTKKSFTKIDHEEVLECNQSGEFGKISSHQIIEKVNVSTIYNLKILAQKLLDHILQKEAIQFKNGRIFYEYLGMFGEVFDKSSKKYLKFSDNFIDDQRISSTQPLTQRFQNILKKLLQTRSPEFLNLFQTNIQGSNLVQTKFTIELLNEYVQKVKIKLINFKADAVSALPETGKTDIRNFLDHLIFAVGQPTESQMDEIILDEIRVGGKMDLSKPGKEVVTLLLKKVTDWRQKKTGTYLIDCDAEKMLNDIFDGLDVFFESATETYQEKPNSLANIVFKNINAVLLEFLDQSNSGTFICCSNQQSTILTTLKIHQILQDQKLVYYFVSIKDFLHSLKDREYHNKSKLFIIDLENSENCCHLESVLIPFLEKNCINKSIIIYPGASESITEKYQKFIDYTTFEDLTEDSQQILLKTKIVHQGAPTALENILDTAGNISQILNEEWIIRLLKEDLVTIGEEILKVSMCHVERYLLSEDNDHKFTEDQLIEFCTKQQNVLISDVAGMGKSSLLSSLIAKYKRNNAHFWVIRINLNDCTDVLEEFKSNTNFSQISSNMLIWELSKNNESTDSALTRYMFDFYFKNLQNRMVLMFDGFDEVCPDYDELTIKIIKKLNGEFKIYLTTRPRIKDRHIGELGLKAFHFERFSEKNQKELLCKYWMEKLPTEKTKLKVYVDAIIDKFARSINDKSRSFTGIPLQIMLIAEYFFKTELKHGESLTTFLDSNREFPNLPERLNILELYQMFIESKFDIMLYDKSKNPKNPHNKRNFKSTKEDLTNFHKQLALYTIFGKRGIMKLDGSFNANLEQQYKRISDVGLVTISTTSIQFLHRTFAEYFVALLLIDNESSINGKLYNKVLHEILILEHRGIFQVYKVIRTFVNEMLHQKPEIKSSCNFIKTLLNLSDSDKTGALLPAAGEGHDTIVKILLNHGAKVNSLLEVKLDLFPLPQHLKNTEPVKKIFYIFININNSTALHYAARNGHANTVKVLLEHGAKINLCDRYGRTPLYWAACYGHPEIVELLLKLGGKINLANKSGGTALHTAASLSRTDSEELLLEHGADVNEGDIFGETALHLAASRGLTDTVKVLIKHGASVRVVDNDGNTAVHRASFNNKNLDTLKVLLENDVDIVNVADDIGRTALHNAAIEGALDQVKLLVEHGAVDARGRDRKTTMDRARFNEHWDVVTYLLYCNVDSIPIISKNFEPASSNGESKDESI